MAPSTHSADVSQIQTDTTAILVDTGTTIPGTITTLQTNASAILVDTGTTIPGTITTLQTDASAILVDTGTTIPGTITTLQTDASAILVDTTGLDIYLDRVRMVVGMASADIAFSTSSATLVNAGVSIVLPSYSGETFTVVCIAGPASTDNAAKFIALVLEGDVLGAPTNEDRYIHPGRTAGDYFPIISFARSGFAAGETVEVQIRSETATEISRLYGVWTLIAYQETQT